SGENIRAKTVVYDGTPLQLGGAVLSEESFPYLAKYVGEELIVTDGTTLLGADDKAGVAEIIATCDYLSQNPQIAHRGIAVAFTPDEEIGRGADKFDVKNFPAKVAYTVDGGELGEIEYENFNAASAKIEIFGVNIHPGSAKNKMKNASLLAAEFISRLPASETPAHTEGYEGFYHLCDMQGDESYAKLNYIIRDHDRTLFENRKKFVENLATYLNSVYGDGTFVATVKDSYYNMKEKLADHMDLIENAKAAMEKLGVEPKVVPIRGGTDGARLSYEGLPCPNLCTGGYNFHSVHEFIPVSAMNKMVEVLVELTKA
ncbi:MAG: peptidase T, partial [Clostridia bacterium]|nr:peptidase T [Clostridia bacterium]